jgi:uncharacterized membrane protein YbhN (UPF0104 family)
MRFKYKYLVYISLIFLLIALYKADYLLMPQIHSFSFLLTSIVLLFVGFIIHVVSWRQSLKQSGFKVGMRECLASTGLSVFGKYIPGKVWVVVGRAAYIAEKTKYTLGALSAISLNTQFLALWAGIVLGVIGLFLLGNFYLWGWLLFFFWILLTTVLFSRIVHDAAEWIVKRVSGKDIEIPSLDLKSIMAVLPWFFLYWVVWSLGFYLLVASMIGEDVPLSAGLGFPLAATLGIMAIVSPGGLGVREGVMVGYLMIAGISLKEATSISIAARLWFLTGEAFIFVVGLMTNEYRKRIAERIIS